MTDHKNNKENEDLVKTKSEFIKDKKDSREKKTLEERLAESLDLERKEENGDTNTDIVEAEVVDSVPSNANENHDQEKIEDDYDFSRNKIRSLIDDSQDAMFAAMKFAEETDDPKAYMALAKMMKEYFDGNEKLLNLSKIKKETEYISDNKNVENNQQNFHFYGDSREMIKAAKKEVKDQSTEDNE